MKNAHAQPLPRRDILAICAFLNRDHGPKSVDACVSRPAPSSTSWQPPLECNDRTARRGDAGDPPCAASRKVGPRVSGGLGRACNCRFGAARAAAASSTATPLPILVLRLIKAAVLVSVSAILLRRRAKDPVAALLALAFLTWTITSSFDFASSNALPLLLDRVRFLLFVLALLLFPDGRWQPK